MLVVFRMGPATAAPFHPQLSQTVACTSPGGRGPASVSPLRIFIDIKPLEGIGSLDGRGGGGGEGV